MPSALPERHCWQRFDCSLKGVRCMALQNGVGNPAPVATLEECQIACESAPGCSSIVYSPGAQNCFLKGCPSENTITCPVSSLAPLAAWHGGACAWNCSCVYNCSLPGSSESTMATICNLSSSRPAHCMALCIIHMTGMICTMHCTRSAPVVPIACDACYDAAQH